MKKIDVLFNDFLDYIARYHTGQDLDIEGYRSPRPYFNLWKIGHERIQEGISPVSMQALLEYEKLRLIMRSAMTQDELLEVVLMEKLIYSHYSGNKIQLQELVQNFASQDIHIKYAWLSEQLELRNNENPSFTEEGAVCNQETLILKAQKDVNEMLKTDDTFEVFFSALRVTMKNSLAYREVEIIQNMIRQKLSFEQIKSIMEIEDVYLQIIEENVRLNCEISDICLKLVQNGFNLTQTKCPAEYKDLDMDEVRLYQIAHSFWTKFQKAKGDFSIMC